MLEQEQQKLQDEIKTFQQEKDELEFILEAHRLHCGVGGSNSIVTTDVNNGLGPHVKVESLDSEVTVVTMPAAKLIPPKPLVAFTTSNATPSRRPTSFPLSSRLVTSSGATVVQVVGNLPIMSATPGGSVNVFTLGLESMMDGHTGLTPITGLSSALGQTPIAGVPPNIDRNQINDVILSDGGCSAAETPRNLSVPVTSTAVVAANAASSNTLIIL